MTMNNKLHHVNLLVDDLATAVPFYRDLVGLDLDETPDQWDANSHE